MIRTPQAVWLTGDSPAQVEREARQVTSRAAGKGEMPVLVAYNIPFRDCAQYSAGGATSVAEYEAWIDAVAAGIGERDAVVLLEPDGLGIIPWYTTINGDKEWCQPAEADAATAASERFAMLNHAVDALGANAGHPRLPRRHPQRLAGRRRRRRPAPPGRGRAGRRLLPQRLELPHDRRTR